MESRRTKYRISGKRRVSICRPQVELKAMPVVLKAGLGCESLAFEGAPVSFGSNVVDVRTGEILGEVTVVLKDGKIESVGSNAPPLQPQGKLLTVPVEQKLRDEKLHAE